MLVSISHNLLGNVSILLLSERGVNRDIFITNNNLFYRQHKTNFMTKFVCIFDLHNSWFAVYVQTVQYFVSFRR